MIVYNVGDSHTDHECNWCPKEKQYWHRIAHNLGADFIVNDSQPGRSNGRIIQLAMDYALSNSNTDVFYIINITTIMRTDLTIAHSDTLRDVLTVDAIATLDFEIIECTLYTQLIGLIEFFKSRNMQFLIINNGKNFSSESLPIRDNFVNYIKQEPNVINWFEDSKTDFHESVSKIKPADFEQYGWAGHDGPAGHDAYYKMLSNKIS